MFLLRRLARPTKLDPDQNLSRVLTKMSLEQRLNAGETVDMPVFFFIDPEFLKDPQMKGIDTVTLSYTFFSECYRSLTCQEYHLTRVVLKKLDMTGMVILRLCLPGEALLELRRSTFV